MFSPRNPRDVFHSMVKARTACIGLGSNLGPSLTLLRAAWEQVDNHQAIEIVRLSSPYRSQPLGMETEHWFVNAVGLVRTTLSPEALLAHLHRVEEQHGRIREPGTVYRDRTLDLDLLLHGEFVIQSPALTLPHPRMLERLFVMVPLAEVAPDLVHPLAGRRMDFLLGGLQKMFQDQCIERMHWPRAQCGGCP